MSDLNWCTFCDNAVNPFSESLYCSEQCLRADALRNHPLLGYTYPEFIDFPRPNSNHYTPYNHDDNSSLASASPVLSATSSKSSNSSIQFSPPKFDLLSSSTTSLPPVTTTTTVKLTHFNYTPIFDNQHHVL